MRIARQARVGAGGFTLLELLVVVAIVALAAAVTSLALPDPHHTRLEREAARLVHLLESARAHARAAGLPVTWSPGPARRPAGGQALGEGNGGEDFHFSGLPARRRPAGPLAGGRPATARTSSASSCCPPARRWRWGRSR
jgi:prepilin-type N-terminal cleavage/methylation domain-containing protein